MKETNGMVPESYHTKFLATPTPPMPPTPLIPRYIPTYTKLITLAYGGVEPLNFMEAIVTTTPCLPLQI